MEWRVLLAFAALVVLALLLAERGISSALAPLCAVCATSLFFSIGGSFGLLAAAGWIFYGGMGVAASWLVFRFVVQKKQRPSLGYGFWFFVLAGLGIVLLLWAKQPMFTSFDEFSFWGTAAKLAKTYNAFYTTAPIGWPWTNTWPPGLVSLSYFVQFLGSGFAEWQVCAAYDLLTVAVFGAMLAPFEKKQWNTAFPVAVLGVLAPFVFTVYGAPQQMTPPYLNVMGDMPMAFLFGGALVAYYSAEKRNVRGMLPVCLALAMLTNTKDIGLALALVVCALVGMDVLFGRRKEKESLRPRVVGALGSFGVCAGSALLPFVGWSLHLSATTGVSKAVVGGKDELSMVQMVVSFFTEMFSAEKSDKYLEVMNGMPRNFVSTRVWLFGSDRFALLGSGLAILIAILLMLVFAAVITRDAAHRRRTIVFAVFSTVGYFLYSLLIAMTYVRLFRENQTFTSYERYMLPYYLGWFLVAIVLLGQAAKNSRFAVEGKVALLALCTLVCVWVAYRVPPAYTLLGVHADEYAQQRERSRAAQRVAERLPADSLTFIVSQGDNGLNWFTYCYEFLPKQVGHSYGGGRVAAPGVLPPDTPYYHPTTREQWEKHLIENEITHIFLDDADEVFCQEYGSLFTDDMDGYFEKGTQLYRVEEKGATVRITPLE